MTRRTLILVAAALIAGGIGCSKDKDKGDEAQSLESTLAAARSVGVMVELKTVEYRTDRSGNSDYRSSGSFLAIRSISWSAVGETEVELIAAIKALRAIDARIDGRFANVEVARDQIYEAVASLQGLRAKLREKARSSEK